MEWLNLSGTGFMIAILIPNIIFAWNNKAGFENKWENKAVELLEQIGGFACFGFMIINIPGTWFGFWTDRGYSVYLLVNCLLVILYGSIWAAGFRRNRVLRSLALSVIPSVLFLFSGVMGRSILLIAGAVIFAPCHILISYKNAKAEEETAETHTKRGKLP